MLEAQAPPSVPPVSEPEPSGGRSWMTWVLLGLGLLLLLVIGIGGFFIWKYVLTDQPTNLQPLNNTFTPEEEVVVNTPVDIQNVAPLQNQNTPLPSPDQDQDGLTADEEAAFGTSDHDADSDNDLLNDREEVMIYKTNPLNPDTDGDKFPDGQEVRNLYNPNGKGRLFSLDDIQS